MKVTTIHISEVNKPKARYFQEIQNRDAGKITNIALNIGNGRSLELNLLSQWGGFALQLPEGRHVNSEGPIKLLPFAHVKLTFVAILFAAVETFNPRLRSIKDWHWTAEM